MANRLQQLSQLAQQVPNLSEKAQARGKSARTALLQQQLGALPDVGKQQVQQLKAQQAGLAGQQQVEQLKQQQQATAQLGQLGVQAQQREGEAGTKRRAMSQQEQQQQAKNVMGQRLQKESLESRKRMVDSDTAASQRMQQAGFDVDNRLQVATQKQRADISKLGHDVKSELLDSRLAFDNDERGRKFSNDRQFADYIISTAKSQNDFAKKMQDMQQVAQNKTMVLDQIHQRLLTIQERGFIDREGDLDAAANIEIARLAAAAQKEAQKAQNDAKNKQSMWAAGGTIIGAGAGALIGGPPGAAIGASLGGAVGTAGSTLG
jgi:hypothetical protein